MSNMIKRSLDPERTHLSPLGDAGSVDIEFDGIQVKVLHAPEERNFKQMVYKAVTATRGNDIGTSDYDERAVEDAFAGGLNQCLEWETVVFEISGVSRGLTHELVRTRKASFAQQSMRHTDMGNPAERLPGTIAAAMESAQVDLAKYPLLGNILGDRASPRQAWYETVELAREVYQFLADQDIPFQDARTVLPIATETYIIAAYPLSEFLNTFAYRACSMFYPEIVHLFLKMREELVAVAGWLEPYVKITCEKTRPNAVDGVTYAHMCNYQGWERVEGHCPLAWAKENNRIFKSRKFDQ